MTKKYDFKQGRDMRYSSQKPIRKKCIFGKSCKGKHSFMSLRFRAVEAGSNKTPCLSKL